MLLQILAPHFVAGIDLESNDVAPILRRSCSGKSLEWILNWSTQKGYKTIMIVKGTVQQVIERPTKFGSYWDIVVEGRKYGTGKKRPPCFDGDVVEFSAEAKGDFFNADPTSFTKLAAAPVVPAAGKAASSVAPAKTWVPEKDRQDTISYQAARNAAIDFTRLALEAGKIDFGKMKGAEAMELLETYVDNYTERFFDDTKNLGHKKTKKAATSEAEPFNDSVEDI